MLTSYIDEENKVLEITVAGKVSHEEMLNVIESFKEPLENWNELRILKRLDSFEGMELMAVIDDLKFLIDNWGNYKKIKKMALVTDKDWAQGIAKAFMPILPGEMEVFDNEDIEEARIWLR